MGYTLEEAVRTKRTKYGDTYGPTCNLIAVPFSTWGDSSASVYLR